MTQEQIENTLMEIKADTKIIRAFFEEDHKVLHGNGKPGLVSDVSELKKDVAVFKWAAGAVGAITVYVLQLLGQFIVSVFGEMK